MFEKTVSLTEPNILACFSLSSWSFEQLIAILLQKCFLHFIMATDPNVVSSVSTPICTLH